MSTTTIFSPDPSILIDFSERERFCEINNGPQIAGAISKNAVVVVFANIRDSGIC
jgi:hypothetical protein